MNHRNGQPKAGSTRRTLLILLTLASLLSAAGCHPALAHNSTPAGPAADDDASDDDASPGGPTPNPFLSPEQRGPYLVGNQSFFFVDDSRPLGCGAGHRSLLTEVWYPAADNAADWPPNTLEDFFLGRWDEVVAAMKAAGYSDDVPPPDFPTGSYRGAPLNPDAPPMPILVFSHSWSGNRFQNFTMFDYLASHGYIVVAPDHTCNSVVTLTADQVVMFHWSDALATLGERVGDLRFLIDVFTQNPPATFAGRLDEQRVAIFGHSMGAITVSETILQEPRARAVVQMAAFGFPVPPVPADLTAASMYFWGAEDKVMHPFHAWHENYAKAMPAPKYHLTFYDTGHFAFSDLCEYVPSMAGQGNGCGTETRIGGSGTFTNPDHDKLHAVMDPYLVAFFGATLFGYAELSDYLAGNHAPKMMSYQFQSRGEQP